jgi:hypothetical protein
MNSAGIAIKPHKPFVVGGIVIEFLENFASNKGG